jgi:hypothetical protein
MYEHLRVLGITLLVLGIMFFPVREERVVRLMNWWWFRVAWLLLVVLVTYAYNDAVVGLIGALLFVMASNVSVVRLVSS